MLEQRGVTESFSSFDRLTLSAWPIVIDTVAVTVSGAPLTGVRLQYVSRPARLLPAVNACWPRLLSGDVVEVSYTAGYATPGDVPRKLVRAMLALIGAYHVDREGGEKVRSAEDTAKRLCRSFKRWTI